MQTEFSVNGACRIPPSMYDRVQKDQGEYFYRLSGVSSSKWTRDLLDPQRAISMAEFLQRYVSLRGKKVIEIGTGCGVNLVVWLKKYGIDGYGVEPEGSEGFGSSFRFAQELLAYNDIYRGRIINAAGENLPFAENSFDIVYSGHVLEHADDPISVLDEGFRVLRPGGTALFCYPNYRSYYDGHYSVFHPPLFSKRFFPWYIKRVFKRDPSFANTLNTELNVKWTREQLSRLSGQYQLELLSLGEKLFIERLSRLTFYTWGGLTQIHRIITVLFILRLNVIAAHLLVKLNQWAPIFLVARKKHTFAGQNLISRQVK